MLDPFLLGRADRARVSEGAASAVAKAAGPVRLKVVRVTRGGAPADTLACVPEELRLLEDQLAEDPGVDSWVVEDREVLDLDGPLALRDGEGA